jgi:cysteinyl-tRNA synthetase
MDLKFPHHENEIAQSCGASGKPLANYWMHNGFVNVDSEKMSKSLGNFFTLREVLPHLRHPEVLRLALVSSQYRGPINYSMANLQQAEATLNGIYTTLRGLPKRKAGSEGDYWRDEFRAVMDEDFNTPKAMAVLQRLSREINEQKSAADGAERAAQLAAVFRELAAVLGVAQLDPEQWFRLRAPGADNRDTGAGLSDQDIEQRIAARLAARKSRDFAGADRLRDELARQGVILEDKPDGTTLWRRR